MYCSTKELQSFIFIGTGGYLLGGGGHHGQEAVEAGHRWWWWGGGQSRDDQSEGEDWHSQGGQGHKQHRGGPHVVKCFLVVEWWIGLFFVNWN